ncbi:MAG: site-2 protease family protein [Planctomycetaceae bacterium]
MDQHPPRLRQRRPRKRLLPLVLFLATCLSTFVVGSQLFGHSRLVTSPFPWEAPRVEIEVRSMLMGGLQYSLGVMAILVAHEMGHFLQARRYGVPASWPWFIPMPFSPLGTMGAVIVQESGHEDRKQMFDIGITGPLAGLVLAIPLTIWGLRDSEIKTLAEFGGGFSFGNPPLLTWLAEWHFGRPLRPTEDITMTPFLHAGWVGILVTALNLMPIGQLDGGHILYGLIGRKAHRVAITLIWTAMFWMLFTWNWSSMPPYFPLVVLLLLMGVRHPPTRDDSVRLGGFRVVLGWMTLAFLLIGFTPKPFTFDDSAPPPPPQRQPVGPPEVVYVWRLPEKPER